ncbi:MAG: hypothetical protein AAF125_20255 [Chloroflexota bacterium]
MYKLHHRYRMAAPTGTISPSGVREIYSLIYQQNLLEGDWKKKNPDYDGNQYLPSLPDEWDWVWVVSDAADYRGKFPKRVSQYYRKVFNLKTPDRFTEAVGNVARAHSEDATEYIFDFTDAFDWEEGSFGDDGSCFWGGNSHARVMLREGGARAVRFYDDKGRGIARAWVYPIEAEGLYIVFNGYGFPGNPTLTIARALARFMERRYKQVVLTNNGEDEGTLWINGGSGYVLGKASRIEDLFHYDLNLPDHES